MADDGKVVVSIAVCVMLTVVGIAGSIAYGSVNNNRTYYAAQGKCVEHGGTWVPTQADAACVGAKP